MKKILVTTAAAAIGLGACAEPDTVVRNDDPAERLAEYERAVDAAGEAQPEALPREVIGDDPDLTREQQGGGDVDRFERPTNSPNTDVTKDSQVGATVCPEPDPDVVAALDAEGVDYDDWLLDTSASGEWMTTGGGLRYTVAQGGIERGYQPQRFNEVVLALGGGGTVTTDPDDLGALGEVVMAMTPCMVVHVDAGALDDTARGALKADDTTGVVSFQLVEVRVP